MRGRGREGGCDSVDDSEFLKLGEGYCYSRERV